MSRGALKPNTEPNKAFALVRLLTSTSTHEASFIHLRDQQINYHMPVDQVLRLKIPHIDHTYLTNIQNFYATTFQHLIEQFALTNPVSALPSAYQDALYHLHYISSNHLDQVSSNSERLMKSLHDYIFSSSSDQPLVLTGPTGSGKTACVSTLASNMYMHFIANSETPNDKALILRFIGIDGKSAYLRSLLKSVCGQMALIVEEDRHTTEGEEDDLGMCFSFFSISNNTPIFRRCLWLDSL